MTRLVCLLALVGTGCAGATHVVGPGDIELASRDLSGRSVTVVLTDGATYAADAFRLDADTTTWIDPATGELWFVLTSRIAQVSHRDRGRSALRTAGAGALITAALGATVGVILCSELGCSGEGYALWGAMALTAAPSGALYGGLGGALVAPPDRWWFTKPEETEAP